MKNSIRGLFVTISISISLVGQTEQRKIGAIDFFGYKGIDLTPIRSALPVLDGDDFPGLRTIPDWTATIRESVRRVINKDPTDVRIICCDHKLNWIVYIGLPGASSKSVTYDSAPNGDSRLSPDIVKLDAERNAALREAVMKGASREDDTEGYALTLDPVARATQLAFREYALRNEAMLLEVLRHSSDPRHRAIAASAVGYTRQSNLQIAALVRASLDPDEQVRDGAVRALGVLASAKPELARQIPASLFIQLLGSGSWADHNKAVHVLFVLTKGRDPDLLKELRWGALDTLLEMARWQYGGHASTARIIIGRIAGIDEGHLHEMVKSGQVEAIIRAL